jgi:hypothetical protein
VRIYDIIKTDRIIANRFAADRTQPAHADFAQIQAFYPYRWEALRWRGRSLYPGRALNPGEEKE